MAMVMGESESDGSDILRKSAAPSDLLGRGDLQVVVSPTGSLGKALVEYLSTRQAPVRGVVLDPNVTQRQYLSSAEIVRADPMNASSLAEAFTGAAVVYDCFEPKYSNWKSAMQEVTKNVLYAAIQSKASLIVSSHLLLNEGENGPLENDVVNAHASSLTKTAVVRMPQLYGPGIRNVLWDDIFESAANGKRAHWLGDLDVPRSLLFVEDAARMMTVVAEGRDGYGKKWNLAGPAPITGRAFMELTFKAVGKEPKVGHWGRGIMLTGSLLGSQAKEFLKLPYDYYMPFVLDGSGFAAAFPEATYTPHAEAVGRTLEWFKSR